MKNNPKKIEQSQTNKKKKKKCVWEKKKKKIVSSCAGMPTSRKNEDSATLTEVLPEQGIVFHDAETPFQAILCKPKLLPIKSFSLERLEKLEKKIKLEVQQRREEEKQRRQQQNSWGTASRAAHPTIVGGGTGGTVMGTPTLRPALSEAAASPSFPPASAEAALRRKQPQPPVMQETTTTEQISANSGESESGGGRGREGQQQQQVLPGLVFPAAEERPPTPPLSVPVPLTPHVVEAPRTPPPAVEEVQNSPVSGWPKQSLPFVPGGLTEEEEVAAHQSASQGSALPFSQLSPAPATSSSRDEHLEGPSPPFPGSPAGSSMTSLSTRSSHAAGSVPPLALMPPPPAPLTSPAGHPATTAHRSRRAKVTAVPPEDM